MIDGTISVRLLHRKEPAAVEARRDRAPLPTVEEFAAAITQAAAVQSDAPERSTSAAPTICIDVSQRLKSVDGSHMLNGIAHLHECRRQGRSLFAIYRDSSHLFEFQFELTKRI